MQACGVHLMAQLACLQPRYVLVFGAVALKALLPDRELKLGECRGRPIWVPVIAGSWPVHWRPAVEAWPTYHPAAALRNSSYQQKIREDLAEFVRWRDGNEAYPFTCVRCKGEGDLFDENGIAWCAKHAGRQLRLEGVS